MARETKEKQIGDSTYRIRQLGGKIGRQVQLRLARSVAAAFSSDRGVDLGRFWAQAKGVRLDPNAALQAIAPGDLDFLCDTFAASTTVLVADGDNTPKPATLSNVYDDHMGGTRALDVWPWLLFALEVNFGGGFFSEVLERAREAKAASRSSSPPAPTGSSGASSSPSV